MAGKVVEGRTDLVEAGAQKRDGAILAGDGGNAVDPAHGEGGEGGEGFLGDGEAVLLQGAREGEVVVAQGGNDAPVHEDGLCVVVLASWVGHA